MLEFQSFFFALQFSALKKLMSKIVMLTKEGIFENEIDSIYFCLH